MSGSVGELTELLRRASAGDRGAADACYELVYPQLRQTARRLMRSQPSNHTLDAEGLLHEAYLKVRESEKRNWKSRGHFLAVMLRAMRQHLIDHARQRARAKRGGGLIRIPLSGILLTVEDRRVDLVVLHDALAALDHVDATSARTLELVYFVGLDQGEIAETLGVSARTVRRNLAFGRTWLLGELS